MGNIHVKSYEIWTGGSAVPLYVHERLELPERSPKYRKDQRIIGKH